jgi:hypothetical protein
MNRHAVIGYLLMIQFTFLAFGTASADGSPSSSSSSSEVSESTLIDMLEWENILPFDESFISPGHENSLVKVYFNALAKPTFASYGSGRKASFAVGSIISKAFIDDKEFPRLKARRVFFMQKMAPGFDPDHGDWSYSSILMDSRVGKFEKVSSGALPECIACHKNYADQDYVLSLERSKQGRQPLEILKALLHNFIR